MMTTHSVLVASTDLRLPRLVVRIPKSWNTLTIYRCLVTVFSIINLMSLLITGLVDSIDGPEVFGMHENVNVAFNKNESLALMSSLLSLQPRSTGGAKKGMSSDDLVLEQADMFEQSLPDLLNEEDAGMTDDSRLILCFKLTLKF